MKKFVSALSILFVLLLAPSASAADLHTVSSGGSTTSTTCPSSDPCTLPRAVFVASPGDNIFLESATYTLADNLEISDATLTIQGPEGRSSSFPTLNFSTPNKGLYTYSSGLRLERMIVIGNQSNDALVTSFAGLNNLAMSRVELVNNGDYPTISASGANIRNSIIVGTGNGVPARLTGVLQNSVVKTSASNMPAVWNTDAYLAPGDESHLDIVNSIVISATNGTDVRVEDNTVGSPVPTVTVRNSLASSSKKFENGSASIAFTVGNLEDQDPALSSLFQQTFSSPGIDNGCNISDPVCTPFQGEKDFFGNPRLSGAGLDIGAHEADQDAPVLSSLRLPQKIKAGKALRGTFLLAETASFPVQVKATLQGKGKKVTGVAILDETDISARGAILVGTRKGLKALPAGKYSYRLCATDAVANTSACLEKTVRITK